MKEVLLSISLLASNRKKTMGKCLESLRGLLEHVESELIVVDTGCDEETLAIIREYTEQIVPFTWCKDFSKARNAGLELAKGKWFMYIDDDEWFEDTAEIEEFFLSGDYKRYNSATYWQRNYSSKTGKDWTDNHVGRMAKRYPHSRFKYAIHEILQPYEGPVKKFAAYVHHYGYVYESAEEKYHHLKRNLDLLKEEKERDPLNLHHYSQIAQEYMGSSEYENCIEICKEGIRQYQKKKDGYNLRQYSILAAYHIESKVKQYRYEDVLELVQWYKKAPELNLTGQAWADFKAMEAAYELQRYKDAKVYGQRFLKAYEDIKKHPQKYQGMDGLILDGCFVERNYHNAIAHSIMSNLRIGDLEAAVSSCELLDWTQEKVYMPGTLPEEVIAVMKEVCAPEQFTCICNHILKRDGLRGLFAKALDVSYAETDEKQKEILLTNLEGVNRCHWSITCKHILYADSRGDADTIHEAAQELIGKLHNFLSIISLQNLWLIFAKYQMNLWEDIKLVSLDRWIATVDEWYQNVTPEGVVFFRNYFPMLSTDESTHAKYMEMKMEEKEFFFEYKEYSYDTLVEKLRLLLGKEERYYRSIYRERVFSDARELLPASYRFFSALSTVVDMVEKGEEAEAISCARTMIEENEGYGEVLKYYLLCLQKRKEKAAGIAAFNEQAQLMEQIKCNIPILLEGGKHGEARAIVEQLLKLAPEDEELKQWLENMSLD